MTIQPLTSLKTPKRLGVLTALVLLAAVSLGARWWPQITSAAAGRVALDPVTAAWEKARAAGSYHFTSDVVQKTIPVASLVNVGRSSRTDALYLEGQNDLHAQTMELTLWSQDGSALNADSGVSVRTENGKTFTRRGNAPWQESDSFVDGFAPQGDFLGYLAAIRHVTARETETRSGITFTRYTFTIDGPTFANYMHEQTITALRAEGELPPGVQLETPAYYRDLIGSGELWVGVNGLPVRQILDLRFPEQKEERVEATITVNFSNYGAEQTGLLTLLRTGQWQGAWLVLPNRLPDLTGLWLGLTLSVTALLMIRYRRTRTLQTALATAVIVSQILGPLLSTMTQTRFFDSYRAKAAAQEEQQAAATQERDLRAALQTAPEFNPHQNPLATKDQKLETGNLTQESSRQSPVASRQSAPHLQTTDTDGDGLTDFTEVRIGTSEVYTDTDDDGLLDNLEVNGFSMGGQTWYTNPNATDSNNDGQADVVEWGIDNNSALPQATPRDTDSDGLPDLFDPDNDNDGVVDRVDSAPYAKGTVTYSEANPLQLTINNLEANKPTFVDFQIRPQDPKTLWFAYNVLDWPQDNDGQVRDIDGQSYADRAAAQGRTAAAGETNGDMKLTPMLEIRIPTASANLPSRDELTPFNISLNNFTADGATQVAYLPLTVVSDPLTGERVAFGGQMRYKPTGSWSAPHSVRLAWVVQALNDLPCDPEAADAAAQGCQPDGYIHNQPMAIHSYYDNWTLTGLNVRAEYGANTAVIYEDPAVDSNKQDEAPLWALTSALGEHFLNPQDGDNNGSRDLKVSDFATRFDRDANPSEAQRFAIANILQVVSNGYSTSDEATMTTAMTTTTSILNSAFTSSVQADNAIKPLLLFVTESSLRAVGLDQVATGEGYATQNGAAVSFDLAPTAQSALPVVVNAHMKWLAYCGANGNTVSWRPCANDEYADVMEQRYGKAPALPDDIDPAEVPGRMMLASSYYATLVAGYQRQVQEGAKLVNRYRWELENETTGRIRFAMQSLTPLTQLVEQQVKHIATVTDRLTSQIKIKETLKRFGDTYFKSREALARSAVIDDTPTDDTNVNLTKAQFKATQLDATAKFPINFERYAAAAPLGSAILLLTTMLSQNPDFDVPTRSVLGAIGVAVTIGDAIYLPAITARDFYKSRLQSFQQGDSTIKPTLSKTLTANLVNSTARKVTFAVGLVANVALTWGFFAYTAGVSGYAVGSPELNQITAEAIASTVVVVLLTVISATFIGTLIAGIISVVDTIFNLICELGIDLLRLQGPVYGGACFSITTTATKVLAYLFYNYEPMINTSRNDLMIAGSPAITLTDRSKGYVPTNTFTLTLPVTTTVVHKDPDPANGLYINGFLWLYSPDNIRSNTFRYGLSRGAPAIQAVDRNQMTGAWQDVREDHKYVLTPMYRGVARTDPAPLPNLPLVQGINSSTPFSLTMNFAIPAYECWPLIFPPTPVCYAVEFEYTNTTPYAVLTYDVLPNTFAEFVALGNKANGGLGQSWEAKMPALADADGDGLRNSAFQGVDPNDTTWDADNDGLSDQFELNRRAAGVAYSPVQLDSDNDGLTDQQEAVIGTDPGAADTDNDGLLDGAEVRHQVYDANGVLTTAWAGGWQVTINSTPARTVWVSSDPYRADSDDDSISDQAERTLAANADPALRVDGNGVPYHPNIPNRSPLAVFTDSSAFGGYIGPNQQLYYTTTVVANVPVEPGVLELSVPAGQNFTPAPALLTFNPLTFSGSQTVTKALNFTVQPVGALGAIDLQSTARTRLQSSGGNAWAIDPVAAGAPLGGFTAPLSARSSALTAARVDRPDSYLLSSVTLDPNNRRVGEVRGYNLSTGAGTILANSSLVNNTSYFPRSSTGSALAANTLGTTLSLWDQRDQCRTLTINSLRVVTAGEDHGTGGIEPFITVVTNDRATSQQIWYWDAAGGAANMTSGQQRGPNAGGFPLTRTLCGLTDLQVWESDGPVNDPAQNTLVKSTEILVGASYNNFNLIFEGAGHRIDLNITIPQEEIFAVAGARLNGDGVVQAPLSFPRPAISATAQLNLFNPVVASDGDGFLVIYEATINRPVDLPTQLYLVAQTFDRDGIARGNSFRLASTPASTTPFPTTVYDLAWIGDRYRVVWKRANEATIYSGDINSNGVFQGSGWTPLVTDASTVALGAQEPLYTPQLAAEPRIGGTERWILTYNRGLNEEGVVLLYPNRDSTTPSANRVFPPAIQSIAAYNPISRGWLVGWYQSVNLTAYPLNLDLSDLVPLTNGAPPFVLATGSNYAGSALACPLPEALPAAEFRFEELPTAAPLTSFVDSSGLNNNALCGSGLTPTTANCPTLGASGAPNAPLSDYAAQFNGLGDRLTANVPSVVSIFSVALWVKAAPNANADAYLVTNTSFQNSYWNLGLKNGIPQLVLASQTPLAGPSRLDDNNWHHVAATFNVLSGTAALYVDGIQVASRTMSPPQVSTLYTIGAANNGSNAFKGAIDHVQLFGTDLAASTVAALYNRTLQPYCVASGASANGADLRWGKLTVRENDRRGGRLTTSADHKVFVDNTAPNALITSLSNNAVVGPDQVIGGTANDSGVGVGKVEVSLNNGAWQPVAGANSWSFSLAGLSGVVNIRARATDLVGNVGNPSAALNVTVDNTPPALTINVPAATLKPTKNASGQWQVALNGTATDSGAIKSDSLVVALAQRSGVGSPQTQQIATVNGNTWSLTYLLAPDLYDPTGSYTVTAQVADKVGNRTVAAPQIVRLDASGPVATLNTSDATRTVITQTFTIGGVISDTNSLVGIDKLEIAFTPIEQVVALPGNISTAAAEAQLNRQWLPVTLAQRGAGVAQTTWSVAIPANLEDEYQIDLRGYDLLGNVNMSAGLWRGMIDTRDPRVVMSATATGATYVNTADNTQRYEVRFVCAAQDRNLAEAAFACPGAGLAEPVRSFENNAALQALFPDLTLRTGLAISYTLWTTSTTPAATARACDHYGRCAQTSAGSVSAASGALQGASLKSPASSLQAAAPGAPLAVIVNPTSNSFVAAGSAVSVTVAAEAGAGLKDVVIKLDNAVVQTLSFAQSPAITRTVRTVNVPVATEGAHTLVAQATAWDNASQTTLFPVVFTLDQNAPTLTIDASALTLADTWVAQSGVLRFNGNASDSVGLAAVQIREGNNGFSDATFGNGTWRVALPVADPEGRTLNITVRAIDRAGRITQQTAALATDLSAADAPDTTISSGPSNPSSVNTAQFVFAGSATAVSFDCQLDNGVYTPCASPVSYSDLSKGSHTFRVRAIDSRGLPDLSPAEYTWTVNAGQPDTTITGKPTNPTTERTATFTFSGDATATRFECSLDGSAYATCTTPKVYDNLGNGEHTFLVRARNSTNGAGAADRYTWTVLNDTPVASDQTLITAFGTAVAVNLAATDNDPLRYKIVQGPAHGVLLGIAPNLTYSPDQGFGGIERFTFVANDGLVDSNLATVTIYVDNVPPVSTITLTPATPTGQNGWYTATVQVAVSATDGASGSGVTETRCVLNPATPPTSFAAISAGCAYSGAGAMVSDDRIHTLYAASIDVAQNGETPVSRAFQIDRTPPTVTCSATPNNVWPPNNQFVTINTTVTVNDATSGPAGFVLISVTNNETGAGDVQGWTVGTPDTQGQLRARRNGNGNGRIYTLTYQGNDVAGNRALCSTTVTVPKSQGGRTDVTGEALPVATILTDTVAIPTETVTTPLTETVLSEVGTSSPEVGAIRLFLPIIVTGGTGEQRETAPTESEEAANASVITGDAATADILGVERMTVEAAPQTEAQSATGHTLYLPIIE